MKIALTTDSFVEGQGGVSTAVAALVRHLRCRGHEVMVYTAADPSHVDSGLDVVGLRALRYERFPGGRMPVAPIVLMQELADFRPDVIHNHSMSAMGIQALAAARLFGIPILGTCHVFLAGFLKYAPVSLEGIPFTEEIAWRYTSAFFNSFPLVTAPSEFMRRELMAHGLRSPAVAVSNGVDTDLFASLPNRQANDPHITFLHVGRLGYEKRVDQVLRAFAMAAHQFPSTRLHIVGDGPEGPALRRLAVELGISDRVNFTGFTPHADLSGVYQQADIFITASTIETQGLVVLEAMSCGLPIVGVDALALPELIHHEVNGLLAPPEDEQALSRAALRLLSATDLRREMGEASRRLALEHSLPVVVEAYEDLYQQVILQALPPLLSRIPKKLDPALAWSSFYGEVQVLKDAGLDRFWEISGVFQQWAGKALVPVVTLARGGMLENQDRGSGKESVRDQPPKQ